MYNIESNYNKSFQYILYSTNIENSDNISNITLTKNIDEISQQSKTSNQKSEKIDTSIKTSPEITIEASPGSSNITFNPIKVCN